MAKGKPVAQATVQKTTFSTPRPDLGTLCRTTLPASQQRLLVGAFPTCLHAHLLALVSQYVTGRLQATCQQTLSPESWNIWLMILLGQLGPLGKGQIP